MVVAIIIAVTAALAIPAATGQLRDRSTQRLAQDVAAAYRNGRTSAMARGGAVLVRFANGEFRVLEGIDGSMTGDVACAELPVAQCNRPAANAWETIGAASMKVATPSSTPTAAITRDAPGVRSTCG